ncbi:MAG: LysE family translocator [Desulfovibrionaceae bacterium]|nr:LysE family translocator [Desulfovibrionaceae bacterium]
MFSQAQLSLFMLSAVLLALTPGPDILTVVARGISQGRRAAVTAALGFSLGCLNHTLILVLGVSALIKASPLAFSIIKYLGALYLAYIGIQMIRFRKLALAPKTNSEAQTGRIFWQSVLANLLNPKVALFFLAFLPQFVVPAHGNESLQLFLLGLIFMLLTLLVFIIVALSAGAVGERMRSHPKVFASLQGLTGLLLIGLGIRLALEKI